MSLFSETEPNGTAATATVLPGNDVVAVGNIFPNGDLDYFSFTGNAGDKVYAATMTSFSAPTAAASRSLTPSGTGTRLAAGITRSSVYAPGAVDA